MLALTGAVKYGSGTLVFGANMVFTDQVTGFMSGVKHSVGRKRVAKQLAEHFEGIRADVEALSPEN